MAGNGKGAQAGPEGGSTTVPPTRALGNETATGTQIAFERGEKEIPQGAERGSQVEIEGGDPTPDQEGPQKPRGLQAEPALFVSNGQISSTDVPSPSGLQPIGAVATSPEHAKELQEKRKADHEAFVRRSPKQERLEEAHVNTLGRAELKALGEQRGYDMPDAGTRATRAAFLAGQDADETLNESSTKSTAKKSSTKRAAKKSTRKGGR